MHLMGILKLLRINSIIIYAYNVGWEGGSPFEFNGHIEYNSDDWHVQLLDLFIFTFIYLRILKYGHFVYF